MWEYPEALEWLYARQGLGIKLGLEKVERLLAELGNPHHSYRAVHIAGTNGKGSVALMLAESLRRSGFRVGVTTSPHLVRFTERIRIAGNEATQEEVAEGLDRVRDAVEVLDRDGDPPTFFECVTALAFLLFAQQEVEWAVVEAGMGGRLDATNVLRPALTIITNVSVDHTAHLGETIPEIAWEKAGIMKPGVPCVTAARDAALWVLKARSHDLRVPMSIVGEDYHVVAADHLVLARPRGESHFAVGMAGAHQHENAAIVVAAAEALLTAGVHVRDSAVRDALALTMNPGRLESFAADGMEVLVDAAHNPAGGAALASHLRARAATGFHLVFGACADKDWQTVLASVAEGCAQVWGVPVRNPRSLDPARIVEAAPTAARAAPDLATALREARKAGAKLVVVAGSLFLAGEARAHLLGEPMEEIRGTQ